MFSSLGSLLHSFRIPFRRRSVQSVFSRRGRRRGFVPSLASRDVPGVSLHDTLSHETLEQRRLLAADVSLDGTVLTVAFDDAADDAVTLEITDTGYSTTGANVSSGTGTITKLVVADAGTAKTSDFTLANASQSLTGGLSIGSNILQATIAAPVATDGGNVAIDSSQLTLSANINSGNGSQTYGADTSISLLNDVNLTTSTGVAGDIGIHIQGTVDSDGTPRSLNLTSEAIDVAGDIGSISPLSTLTTLTEQDIGSERGQFYRSVTTVGEQQYTAGTTSGDIEFNGTYTTTDSNITLLGDGSSWGVYLSLIGDTAIDVGTGAFSVQRVGNSGGQIFSNNGPYNLSIDAQDISVQGGIGRDDASILTNPEINVMTLAGTSTNLTVSEIITTGGIEATTRLKPQTDLSLLSGAAPINLSGVVSNTGVSLTLGDSNQTGDIRAGGQFQVGTLSIGAGDFDVEFNTTSATYVANQTAPVEFKNSGNVTLAGPGQTFAGGISTVGVANTFVAGCVSTWAKDITLDNVTMLDSSYNHRFDTRWKGPFPAGGNINISNFNSTLSPSPTTVEFDIGNTTNTLTLSGSTESTNYLQFKGSGNVDVLGPANLAGQVAAQNLVYSGLPLENTTPSLNFSDNVTLTGSMEFEGTTATFANGVEGAGNDLTINFTQTSTVDGFANVANFTSLGAADLNGTFTTSGSQNYAGDVSLSGDTELVATTVEFSDGLTGNSHDLTLSPSNSYIKLDGIQLSGVNELTIGGDLELAGNLDAQNIDIQGNTTLLGDANLTATGTASGDWSTASLTNTVVTSGSAMKLTLSPDGRHAYIADDNEGMQVVDLQHPSGPAIVGNFDSGVGNALDVVANATHAFVSHWMGDLHIVDVSNPSSPQSTGNVSLPDMGLQFGGTPFGLSLHGDALYVADGSAGIHHVDVSDPANPSVSENFGTVATFFGVTVAGGYTFAATSAGLKVYNVARTNVATASLSGNGDARSVVVSADGQTAFLANFNGGLDIFDISTPSNPQLLDSYSTAGYGHDVALSSDESLAFVADGPNGKLVLDVSDTSDIKFVGNHATTGSDTDGNVYDVAVASDDSATYTVTHKSENDPGKAGLDIFSSVTQGILFGGTVDGAHALSTNGTTSFAGVVGGTDSLASLTTVGGTVSVGGDVTTTGNQSFGGEATIAGNTTFTGNDVSISGLEGGGFDVEFSTTTTTIDANAYSVANVADLTVSGDVGLNGTIATTGNQLYSGDVGLIGNTTLVAGAGAISLGTGGEVVGESHTLTLGDASQTGAVTLGGSVDIDGLEVGQGAFDLSITTSQGDSFNVSKFVDIPSNGTLNINTDENSPLNFESGLNATNPSSINLAGAIASSGGPGLFFGYAKVGYGSQNATLTVGGNETATISFNTLEINGGKLNYNGPIDIGDLNITNAGGAADVGINGTGYFHVSGDASVTGNVSSGGNLSDGGSQFYDGNVTLTGTAGFTGKSADFQKGVTGNNNNLTLGLTEQSTLDGIDNVKDFTSYGEILLDGSFETTGFQNFAGGINLAADTTLHAASGFIKLDGIQGENYELTIGNTSAPSPLEADLTIEGDVNLNSLNATSGNYNASLIGSPMKFQQVTLLNSGNVTLGQNNTTDLVVEDGIVVDKASATFVAGTIASNGAAITLHNISLNADTLIDTTNGGLNTTGAEILLKESITFNAHTLTTDGGARDTDFRGNMTLQNGTLDVTRGDVNLGESGNATNAANITIAEQMTINVPESGVLNVFDGSQVDAGTFPINIKANTINFESNAGSFTSTDEIAIVPATVGNNIFVGDATGDGLNISQTTFDKMQAPNVVIGGAGYTGTITVENLNSTNSGQLSLIANGTGGAIDISGGLDLQGQDSSGISLYVKGSGATTDLNGSITTAGAAFFDDAVRLVGDTNIVTSGGDVAITGGTDGIYSQSGSSHNLSINAGAGDVVVGNATGFGNGTTESLIGKVTLDSTSSITLGDGDQEMHSLDVLTSPLELGGSLGTSLILSGGLFGGADLRTGITGNKSFLEIDLQSGFVDVVKLGSITNVNNLAITEDSLSPSPLRKVEMHGDVTTIEGQSYEPTIELRNAILLNAAGDVSINGTLTAQDGLIIPRNVGVTATGGTVSIADFGNGTTLGNHYDVAILAADDVNLGGGVGFNDETTRHGLQFLTINTITNSVNFNAASGLSLGGNLSIESSPNVTIGSGAALETFGDLTINSTDISLGANVTTDSGTLTLNGTASVTDSIVLDSATGDLTVTGALLATTNGTHDVTINSGGTAKIGGAVGNATAASDLFFANLTTDAGGTTEFNGNIFAQEQVFNDDIVLNQGLSTNLTAGGVNATFNGNVNAESSDIVLDFNTTAIDGSKWSNLGELTVNADAGGAIGLNGTITSSGSQTYNGAVQLDGDTTLVGGFALNLPQGVVGNSKNLVLDFINQPTSLAGNFTGINDLTSKGDVLISGDIRTSGNQSYDAGVTLDGDTLLDGNSLSLNGVNGGDNDLIILFNTTTAINSNWTNIKDFQAGTTVSLTGNFSTLRQWYQNAVTLLGDTVLSASGSGYRGVAFDGTIDGRHDLSINADSTASINLAKAVGSTAPLQSLNLASAASVEALESLTIDGTGGSGPGLRIGPAVDNVNISQPGSTITNAAQEGILFAGGSANSTVGGFTITNSGGRGVLAAAGSYTGSTFSNSTVTGSGGDGFTAFKADGLSVTDSEFSTNVGDGIHFDAVSNATAQNNVIGSNDFYGVLVVSTDPLASTSNVSVTGNFIGTNVDEDNTANGRSGIWVLGNARGHGTVDTVSITGNTIANNAVHGIEVWSATNVTLGGTRGESSENIISNNAQYGIAFTDVVTNSVVHGNTLLGNIQAGLYLNSARGVTVGGGVDGKGSLDIQQSDFGVVAGGDLTGTNLVGNRVHENRQAGFQLLGAREFHLFRNTIENNGPYGVLAIGDSSNSRISGNTISRHGAGVWLAGASGMVIGSLAGISNEQAVGNKIEDNSSVGIIIQGEDSFDNVILSNQIDANIYYGIQFIQGARTVSVPRLVSVTTAQITGRITGDDGEVYRIQFFYTPAAQAVDGRTSQGEFLIGYEDVTIVDGAASISLDISSSDVVAGDVVTATATLMHNGTPSQSSSFSQGRRVQEASV